MGKSTPASSNGQLHEQVELNLLLVNNQLSLARYFHPFMPVRENELVFSNGVTSICEMLAFVLGEPGDGILLGSPSYQSFPADFGMKGS